MLLKIPTAMSGQCPSTTPIAPHPTPVFYLNKAAQYLMQQSKGRVSNILAEFKKLWQ